MRGLYIKSTDILISISITDTGGPQYYVYLRIVNFSTSNVDYFQIGPDISSYYLSRVIFLSDTRYFMQFYSAGMYLNNNDPTTPYVTF
jgi:hypothetical protein